MTYSNDRLDRIEAIVESNARAIQGIADQIVEDRLNREERSSQHEERMARLEEVMQRISSLNEGVVAILGSLDDDRPTIFRRLNAIENKLDRLLGDPGQRPAEN